MDPSTVEPARGTAACALDKSAWSQSLSGAEFIHTESALLGDPWLSDCAILREWTIQQRRGPEIFINADCPRACHLVLWLGIKVRNSPNHTSRPRFVDFGLAIHASEFVADIR